VATLLPVLILLGMAHPAVLGMYRGFQRGKVLRGLPLGGNGQAPVLLEKHLHVTGGSGFRAVTIPPDQQQGYDNPSPEPYPPLSMSHTQPHAALQSFSGVRPLYHGL